MRKCCLGSLLASILEIPDAAPGWWMFSVQYRRDRSTGVFVPGTSSMDPIQRLQDDMYSVRALMSLRYH